MDAELEAIIRSADHAITFAPRTDEPDFSSCPALLALPARRILLPADKDADPYAWADACMKVVGKSRAVILVPGTAFDHAGTRHGRGGGWYDRFLSKVPRAWTRIGIAHETQVHAGPLERQAHDEPVDWLAVARTDGTWATILSATP